MAPSCKPLTTGPSIKSASPLVPPPSDAMVIRTRRLEQWPERLLAITDGTEAVEIARSVRRVRCVSPLRTKTDRLPPCTMTSPHPRDQLQAWCELVASLQGLSGAGARAIRKVLPRAACTPDAALKVRRSQRAPTTRRIRAPASDRIIWVAALSGCACAGGGGGDAVGARGRQRAGGVGHPADAVPATPPPVRPVRVASARRPRPSRGARRCRSRHRGHGRLRGRGSPRRRHRGGGALWV